MGTKLMVASRTKRRRSEGKEDDRLESERIKIFGD